MSTEQHELIAIGPTAVETFPDTAAWLAARRHGIGASEAAAVVGASPWKSALSLYAEKLGLTEPDPLEREAVEWGLLLEPVIAVRYAQVTGRAVSRPDGLELLRSRQHPFMVATLDGAVVDPARGRGVLEIKTASAFKAAEWEDDPPLAYQVQVQHAMAVADVPWAALVVLLGGQRLLHFDIERNDRFLAVLIAREAEFWDRLVRQDPPPIDGSRAGADLLRALYPRETAGLVVNLPGDAVEWDQQRLDALETIKRAEALKLEAENHLKAAIGEAEAGCLPNGTTYTWRASERAGYTVQPTVVRTLCRKEFKP